MPFCYCLHHCTKESPKVLSFILRKSRNQRGNIIESLKKQSLNLYFYQSICLQSFTDLISSDNIKTNITSNPVKAQQRVEGGCLHRVSHGDELSTEQGVQIRERASRQQTQLHKLVHRWTTGAFYNVFNSWTKRKTTERAQPWPSGKSLVRVPPHELCTVRESKYASPWEMRPKLCPR